MVDETWTQYVYNQQDTSTAGVYITEYEVADQRNGSSSEIDLFGDLTNINVNDLDANLQYPRFMNTGYLDLNVPVVGNATLGLKDKTGDADLSPLVGKHVLVNVSAFIESSTVFDGSKPTRMTIDVGKLLVGAVWLTGPTLRSGTYTRRVTGILSGLLTTAVSGLWTVNVAWQVNHAKAINDKWDSFILHIDLQVMGYFGTRALLVLER